METRPSADGRQGLGLDGERAAAVALRRAGMAVLERRFRCRYGEIDLVAESGELVVFVEVKTRRGRGYGTPAESVTETKQRRLARAALAYLQRRGWLERRCRFDVVQVLVDREGRRRIEHIVDAFRPASGGRGPH